MELNQCILQCLKKSNCQQLTAVNVLQWEDTPSDPPITFRQKERKMQRPCGMPVKLSTSRRVFDWKIAERSYRKYYVLEIYEKLHGPLNFG